MIYDIFMIYIININVKILWSSNIVHEKKQVIKRLKHETLLSRSAH